jgi:rubrerythrin
MIRTMTRVAIDSRAAVQDPEPTVEARAALTAVPPSALPEFMDVVDFFSAGSSAEGEFRCADCGYGAVDQQVLPSCPMCQGDVWERGEPHAAHFDY